MITAIRTDNVADYKALFEEAADILSGYKRVRTYDTKVSNKYYYKNGDAANFDELYIEIAGINDLDSFAAALADYGILYVRETEKDSEGNDTGKWVDVADGFNPMMGITTLEEYFAWIKDLGARHRKYTVLPLNEPHFEINSNTRAINIPSEFKKNGIAVQGDDLAEVVYFKIDRYFDYMDLNNCDIFIQWETPKDANGNVSKNVSAAYIRDIESEPGKLIFGWAISDAVTGAAGNLKFSVRFYQWEDEQSVAEGGTKTLAYSLSTLTATVNIQPSINFNPETDEYKVDDVGQRLVERLENSEVVGGYAAAIPAYLINLLLISEENVGTVKEGYDLDKTKGDTYRLLVQANSSDTGVISYTWKYQDLTPENTIDGTEIRTVPSESVMIEVPDYSNLTQTMNYYQPNGTDKEGNIVYTMYRGTIPLRDTDLNAFEEIEIALEEDYLALQEKGQVYIKNGDNYIKATGAYDNLETYYKRTFTLFTKQSACIADNYGVYWAVAENRITNSSASAESVKARFLRPTPVVIPVDGQPEENAILVNTAAEGDPITLECDITVTPSNVDGDLSYQWYYDANHTLNFGGIPPIWSEDDLEIGKIAGATEATYTATKAGHYKVHVFNTRNKDTKDGWSDVSRVTAMPAIPVIKEIPKNEMTFYVSGLSDDNCPKVTMEGRDKVDSDYYIVDWYLAEFKADGSYVHRLITTDNLGLEGLVSKFNPKNYAEQIIAASSDGDIDGNYFAVVTNHVNGHATSTPMPKDQDDGMFFVQ